MQFTSFPHYKVVKPTGVVAASQLAYGKPMGLHGNTNEAMHYNTPSMLGDNTASTFTIMGKAYPKNDVYIAAGIAALGVYFLFIRKKSSRRK